MRAIARGGVALAWLLLFSAPLKADFPDGTLLFLENCNSVVEWTTKGEIAHVAILFHVANQPQVFEATPGQVRRVALDVYLTELARLNRRRGKDNKIRLLAISPLPAYTNDEIARMRIYLNDQLGRRYSVKNYVWGKTYDGIHCAELASSTLNQSRRSTFADCHKLHPQAFYDAVLATHAAPLQVNIPPLLEAEPWYARLSRRWTAAWLWCRWSSREAWLFFW